jgi:GTP-binding protein
MKKLNEELTLYKPALAQKPQIVAVNKVDLPEVQSRLLELKNLFKSSGVRAHFISGITRQGVSELMSAIAEMLDSVREDETESETPPVVFSPKPKARRG